MVLVGASDDMNADSRCPQINLGLKQVIRRYTNCFLSPQLSYAAFVKYEETRAVFLDIPEAFYGMVWRSSC